MRCSSMNRVRSCSALRDQNLFKNSKAPTHQVAANDRMTRTVRWTVPVAASKSPALALHQKALRQFRYRRILVSESWNIETSDITDTKLFLCFFPENKHFKGSYAFNNDDNQTFSFEESGTDTRLQYLCLGGRGGCLVFPDHR